jgi:hypothetical protein
MLAEPKYDFKISNRNTNRHLTNLTIPDMTITYISEATDNQLARLPYSAGVTNGHLILDGDLIDHIEYVNEDMLAWTRKTDSKSVCIPIGDFNIIFWFCQHTSNSLSTTGSKDSMNIRL